MIVEDSLPCPPEVLDIVAESYMPVVYDGSVFDPCAGDGAAVRTLANRWGYKSCALEVDDERFAECITRVDYAVHGDLRRAAFEGAPDVLFFNPPFDPDDKTSTLEAELWCSVRKWFRAADFFCALLLPTKLLQRNDFGGEIAEFLPSHRLVKLPSQIVEQYEQTLICGWHVNPLRSGELASAREAVRREFVIRIDA